MFEGRPPALLHACHSLLLFILRLRATTLAASNESHLPRGRATLVCRTAVCPDSPEGIEATLVCRTAVCPDSAEGIEEAAEGVQWEQAKAWEEEQWGQ